MKHIIPVLFCTSLVSCGVTPHRSHVQDAPPSTITLYVELGPKTAQRVAVNADIGFNDMKELVKNECSGCHGQGTRHRFQVAQFPFVLTGANDTASLIAAVKARINSRDSEFRMPRSRALKPFSLATLNQWFDGGMQATTPSAKGTILSDNKLRLSFAATENEQEIALDMTSMAWKQTVPFTSPEEITVWLSAVGKDGAVIVPKQEYRLVIEKDFLGNPVAARATIGD